MKYLFTYREKDLPGQRFSIREASQVKPLCLKCTCQNLKPTALRVLFSDNKVYRCPNCNSYYEYKGIVNNAHKYVAITAEPKRKYYVKNISKA